MDVEVLSALVVFPGFVQCLELAGVVSLHGKMEHASHAR